MVRVTRHPDQTLRADPARVLPRLFLPAADLPGNERAQSVIDALLRLRDDDAESMAADLVAGFFTRHHDVEDILQTNAAVVMAHAHHGHSVSGARELLLGALFTAERAVEGAAVCNPSAVAHPRQDGLDASQLRVALSLRAIGEGHLSSIEFCSAVVGPGRSWAFEPRSGPLVAARVHRASVKWDHLRAMLHDADRLDVLARSVLDALPPDCTSHDLEKVLEGIPVDLLITPDAALTIHLLRGLVSSSHVMTFPDDVSLSQQVLLPADSQESHGMEDARFVQFRAADGSTEYRATYTAYDGHHIAPRLLVSADLRSFRSTRLTGPGARNKGMALFPRPVAGRLLALSRGDGVRSFLTSSSDGVTWERPVGIDEPRSLWQLLQVGNCGSPVETEQGWLVLTHGVGPMRRYSIGAMLLDLDDPAHVVARLEDPLLRPDAADQEGYVPNVVYSCGGLVHDGTLWVPYGIGDARIGIASVNVTDLIDAMVSTNGRAG